MEKVEKNRSIYLRIFDQDKERETDSYPNQ